MVAATAVVAIALVVVCGDEHSDGCGARRARVRAAALARARAWWRNATAAALLAVVVLRLRWCFITSNQRLCHLIFVGGPNQFNRFMQNPVN
jgi:hypothetical protein